VLLETCDACLKFWGTRKSLKKDVAATGPSTLNGQCNHGRKPGASLGDLAEVLRGGGDVKMGRSLLAQGSAEGYGSTNFVRNSPGNRGGRRTAIWTPCEWEDAARRGIPAFRQMIKPIRRIWHKPKRRREKTAQGERKPGTSEECYRVKE